MGEPESPQLDLSTIPQRMIDKIEFTETCWLWIAAKTERGYGLTTEPGRKNILTHRYFYEKLVGEIPKSYSIDHLCRVRNCVNPAHLEAVTPKENVLRGIGHCAINAIKTHCIKGHPLEGENLGIRKRENGGRYCKTCRLESSRAYKQRNKDSPEYKAKNNARQRAYAVKRKLEKL